ncbi:MAG: Flp family type IVb pilin [Marmoricola sp.]
MLELIRKFTTRRDEDGASAVEYGLLVAGIAALIVAIVFLFGGVVKNAFNNTCGKVSSGVANGDGTVTATTCA